MRLTDWIVDHVERAMQQQLTKITIPDDVGFADLRLARDPDGHVSFDWTPIARICEASGIDVDVFRNAPEDNVADLIVHWYAEHLRQGGTRDPVQDDLVAEIASEDARGGGISHAPGTA